MESAQTYANLRRMDRLVSIGKAAEMLGVSISTLRRWETQGKITPARTQGGTRRYDLAALGLERGRPLASTRRTIAYARVSSHDQKADLERQKQVLGMYCASQGWTHEVVSDLGSGLNYRKKGLRRLLNEMMAERVDRLVVTHKDRLLRFGAELVFAVCEAREVEVVILNKGEDASFEEDLARDVLEIITVFSARLYGARSRRNACLLAGVKQAVRDASKVSKGFARDA